MEQSDKIRFQRGRESSLNQPTNTDHQHGAKYLQDFFFQFLASPKHDPSFDVPQRSPVNAIAKKQNVEMVDIDKLEDKIVKRLQLNQANHEDSLSLKLARCRLKSK